MTAQRYTLYIIYAFTHVFNTYIIVSTKGEDASFIIFALLGSYRKGG